MATTKVLVKSIIAGMLIAIGSLASMKYDGIISPILFSVGLMSILLLKMSLFTGVLPYISTFKEMPLLVTILIGNLIGCCVMFLFPADSAAVLIIENKIQENIMSMFLSSVMCNILIYIAVEANKQNNLILVIMAIVVFITCGFNHSIANMCYIVSSRMFTMNTLKLLVVSVIGNFVGGISFRKCVNYACCKN